MCKRNIMYNCLHVVCLQLYEEQRESKDIVVEAYDNDGYVPHLYELSAIVSTGACEGLYNLMYKLCTLSCTIRRFAALKLRTCVLVVTRTADVPCHQYFL